MYRDLENQLEYLTMIVEEINNKLDKDNKDSTNRRVKPIRPITTNIINGGK